MFRDHVARLGRCPSVEASHPRLYALLFLSGLSLTFCCFKADFGDGGALPCHMPSHSLDDGLCDMARNCLSALVKRVKSREMREMVKSVNPKGTPRPTWFAVTIAFIEFFNNRLFDNCQWEVTKWIERGDPEVNRVRLACAMGIESLWGSNALATDILTERPSLDADELAAIDAFTLTRENALPDL